MTNAISSEMSVQAWIMLLILSVVWGGSFYFNAILVRDLPSMTIVFLRVSLAALFLWIYVLVMGIAIPKTLKAWRALLIMGVLNNVLPFSLIVWAQTTINSSLASILNATVPMMTVVLAAVLLDDENISLRKFGGVVVGFIGTFWIIAPDVQTFGSNHLFAQLAMLGAALSYSFASIFGRRFSKMKLSPVTTAAGQVSTSALLMLPIMIVVDQPHLLPMPSVSTIAAMLALALVSTAFAYILYFRILATAGATNLGLVTFLIPVWASLFGIWLLSESLSSNHIIGVAIIAVGLTLIDGRLWSRKMGNKGPGPA